MIAKIIAIFLSGGYIKVTNPTEICERRQSSTDGDWKGRWSKLHQSLHKGRVDCKCQHEKVKVGKKRRQDIRFKEYPPMKDLGFRRVAGWIIGMFRIFH